MSKIALITVHGMGDTDSDYYRAGGDDAENAIRGGATLAGALEATHLFPRDFISRVEISEHSGTDAESMAHLAQEYDERARGAVRMLAWAATILVRVSVMLFLIFMIYRIGSFYISTYNEALSPI